jgi:hypothetical protein
MPKMVMLSTGRHYLSILCIGKSFFLTNSLSGQNEGHFLPDTKELSLDKAMDLFTRQAYAIVFECVEDVSSPAFVPQPPALFSKYVLNKVFTGDSFFRILTCKNGKSVRIYSEGSVYDHITDEFIGTISTPTIFVDPMTKSFVEVLYEEPEQLVPQSPAQYASFAPVPQRSAPISKAQSKSKITVDDIRFHSTKWSCSGKSYSGPIEKVPYFMNPHLFVDVYMFETLRFTDPQTLVEFLNLYESVNQ